MPTYRPNIWFESKAEEAAEYYVDVFDDARIGTIMKNTESAPGETGTVVVATWWLGDTEYAGINGGDYFKQSEAFSIEVVCEDQAEVDRYWNRLVGDGGEESQCGWCKDKYGVSWQIIPKRLYELLADESVEDAVNKAMFQMQKLDVATLEAAAEAAR